MKGNNFLNYAINISLMGILLVGTFFLPKLYSYRTDSTIFNVTHHVEREDFILETGIDVSIAERLSGVLDALMALEEEDQTIKQVLNLAPADIKDPELLLGLREEVTRAVECGLLPDILAYDLEGNIQNAEFYNLGNNTAAGGDISLWAVYVGDYKTFEFVFWIDATSYVIYYAELSCQESDIYWKTFEQQALAVADEKDAENPMVEAVMAACDKYYETDEVRGTGIDNFYQLIYGDVGRFYCYEKNENIKKTQPVHVNSAMGFEILRRHINGTYVLEPFGAGGKWIPKMDDGK